MGRRPAPLIRLSALLLAPLLWAGCGGLRVEPVAPGEARGAGIELYRSGELIGALQHLRAAVRHDPADALAYPYLAYCYFGGGWEAEGYEHFRELLAIVERSGRGEEATALRYLAAAFGTYTGDGDAALAHLRRAREARPPTAREARWVSEALVLSGRLERAVELLRELTAGADASPEIRLDLAHALWRAGRAQEAFEEVARLRRELPDHTGALGMAALARFAQGDLEGSQELTESWLGAEPGNPEALWNLTRIALANDERGAADTLLSTVVASGR